MTTFGFSPYHELPCAADASLDEPMCRPEWCAADTESGLSLWAFQMQTWFEPTSHPDATLVSACVPSTWTHWAEMSMSFMRQLSHHTSSFTGRLYKPGIVFLQSCVRLWHRLSTDACKTMAVSFYRHLHQFCWHRHLYGWIECPSSRSMISEICWYNNHSNMQS
jgi:hypothetical protein